MSDLAAYYAGLASAEPAGPAAGMPWVRGPGDTRPPVVAPLWVRGTCGGTVKPGAFAPFVAWQWGPGSEGAGVGDVDDDGWERVA